MCTVCTLTHGQIWPLVKGAYTLLELGSLVNYINLSGNRSLFTNRGSCTQVLPHIKTLRNRKSLSHVCSGSNLLTETAHRHNNTANTHDWDSNPCPQRSDPTQISGDARGTRAYGKPYQHRCLAYGLSPSTGVWCLVMHVAPGHMGTHLAQVCMHWGKLVCVHLHFVYGLLQDADATERLWAHRGEVERGGAIRQGTDGETRGTTSTATPELESQCLQRHLAKRWHVSVLTFESESSGLRVGMRIQPTAASATLAYLSFFRVSNTLDPTRWPWPFPLDYSQWQLNKLPLMRRLNR